MCGTTKCKTKNCGCGCKTQKKASVNTTAMKTNATDTEAILVPSVYSKKTSDLYLPQDSYTTATYSKKSSVPAVPARLVRRTDQDDVLTPDVEVVENESQECDLSTTGGFVAASVGLASLLLLAFGREERKKKKSNQ